MATDDNTICIAPDGSHDLYYYQVKEDMWKKGQNRCPQKNFALVVFGNELTAVGGEDASGCVTGKVLTLRQGKWIEELPPLIQLRSDSAVVSTDSHLFAIGGYTGNDWCSSVELLHRGDQAWTSLTSLPTTTTHPSATVIGENIYIMANWKNSFFSSLADILANKKSFPLLTWQPLPLFKFINTPSSCSLEGQLVIVVSDGTIYQLLHGKWKECGHLSGEYRHFCLLASPSPRTMVAVGGGYNEIDKVTVDECIVV